MMGPPVGMRRSGQAVQAWPRAGSSDAGGGRSPGSYGIAVVPRRPGGRRVPRDPGPARRARRHDKGRRGKQGRRGGDLAHRAQRALMRGHGRGARGPLRAGGRVPGVADRHLAQQPGQVVGGTRGPKPREGQPHRQREQGQHQAGLRWAAEDAHTGHIAGRDTTAMAVGIPQTTSPGDGLSMFVPQVWAFGPGPARPRHEQGRFAEARPSSSAPSPVVTMRGPPEGSQDR